MIIKHQKLKITVIWSMCRDVHRSTRGELLSRSLSDNRVCVVNFWSSLYILLIHRNMEHINCKVHDLYTKGAGSYLGQDTNSPATGFVFLSPTKQMPR